MLRLTLPRLRVWALLVFPLLALAGCDHLFPRPAKPKPPAMSSAEQAQQYVFNQAVARVVLGQTPEGLAIAKPFVQSMNAYAAKKQKRTGIPLTVLVLEYAIEGEEGKQKLVVPIAADGKDFSDLQEVLRKLSGSPYTLHNLRVYRLSFVPPGKRTFSTDYADALRQQLLTQQQQWLSETRALPLKDNAELQLALVRFFMQEQWRDAAYLALENAKEALARMEAKEPEHKEALESLSKEVDILENNLRRDMPYHL